MKILVTGGAGFIGSNLVDKLISLYHDVVVIDDLSTGRVENLNSEAKFYKMDICDKDILEVFKKEKFDIVYHMAAQIDIQKSIKDPINDAMINIIGTINILEACRKSNVNKIIYSSTAAAYGNPNYLGIDEEHYKEPISFYGSSKLSSEYYIPVYSRLYDLDYTILRYSNVYGIRQDKNGEGGVVSIFLENIMNYKDVTIFGDGSATRDYIYVEDVVNANINSIEYGNGEVFNIGTGKYTSVIELFGIMKNIANKNIDVVFEDERLEDIKDSYFEINKSLSMLNWKPEFCLEYGLRKTMEYYESKYI
ncbi:NAD-dependent epimerase/dehydratase family protein [Tepidibacter hydrothermalis]|uniref:NAD-dependent epimerase/dehydratase family protein n=1 Tax=Tepidibacter hydrothermalis TaxID=3036126 RepID=A0ABY8EBF1_9FIRM|nr:NAD-dependent epimerase/dehydratase family protein [Tepidibacter hydrothermalis]WFD10247.1 NAD-dependent epimerase/dehydratase family protein [Tepidibacter hydrothermalis]